MAIKTDEFDYPANVMVIDAFFLNASAKAVRKIFEENLGRKLPAVDLGYFIELLGAHMGMRAGDNQCTVILLNDEESAELEGFDYCDIEKELNLKGFKDHFGDFTFLSAPTGNIVSRSELFKNLLDVIIDSKQVKRLGLFPHAESYDNEITTMLELKKKDLKKMNVTLFLPNGDDAQMEDKFPYSSKTPVYCLMLALGLTDEEVQEVVMD